MVIVPPTPIKIKSYLPIDINTEYEKWGLPVLEVTDNFALDFVKTLNILRNDAKYFSNNMMSKVADWFKNETKYISFSGAPEERKGGIAEVEN